MGFDFLRSCFPSIEIVKPKNPSEVEIEETVPETCPECGKGKVVEAENFKGCFGCDAPKCGYVILNGTGARNFHEELCRQAGLTADEIIFRWNAENPGDEW